MVFSGFEKGFTPSAGGGDLEPSAFYAGIGAGAAVQGICPKKEREGYTCIHTPQVLNKASAAVKS